MASGIFISHSSHAGPQVQAFLEALPDALRLRSLEPFLDTEGLRAGHTWRPVLYRKLAECEGAVLALGPEALGRPWVIQEATILAWRRSLREYAGRTMPVVAVLLDGVTRKEVVDAFPALNLSELESYPRGSVSVLDPELAAEEVAKLFPPGLKSLEDPLQWWTAQVGEWLTSVKGLFLDRVGSMLDIDKDDWDPLSRCHTLADTLLHAAPFDLVEEALDVIVGSGAGNAREVVSAVLPVAVSAATARVLLAAMHESPGDRVAALNTSYQTFGELLVKRATCCDRGVVVVQTPVQMTGDLDGVYADIVRAMGEKAGAIPPESFGPAEMRFVKKNLVVVLQRSDADRQGLPLAVLEPVLERLRADFPTCVFLILSGTDYPDDLHHLVPEALRAAPPLNEDEQKQRYYAVNRLRASSGLEASR